MHTGDTFQTRLLQSGFLIAGRYRIEQLIGSGGMGSVYVATDLQQNDKQVAVKVLHSEFVANRDYVERFIREMELMEVVDHPNVVRTFDFGTFGELVYLTMEYVPGHSLAHAMEHAEPIPEIGTLVLEICEGLDAIHAADIIHRDLKPANILIAPDGSVKITDFGVARPKASRMTKRNQKLGSVEYMAPEIWKSQTITAAADFYSLGVLLYELAVGHLPFVSSNPIALAELHLKQIPRPPSDFNQGIAPWLNQLILALLSKNPADRLNSAEKVAKFIGLHSPLSRSRDKLPRVSDPSLPRVLQVDSGGGKVVERKRSATVVLELTATKNEVLSDTGTLHPMPKHGKTIVMNLPKGAAVIIELEPPSRDFIYFGVFLASLQICDGILTSIGVQRYGITAEGNLLLRSFMRQVGPTQALVAMKALMIFTVVLLTVLAQRMSWIKNLIGALSCVYLFAAILPWCYLLFLKHR